MQERTTAQLRERALAALAREQHGVVALGQLEGIGFTTSAVDRRVAAGRLHRIFPGVYAVGRADVPQEGRWLAAVLASGGEAVLSHGAAAALWGFGRRTAGRIDVTVPGDLKRAPHPGIRHHRSKVLPPCDRTVHAGIRVTTPARTLLDVAAVEPRAVVEREVEAMERLGLFDLTAIERLLEDHPGRRGTPTLRAAAAAWRGPDVTRSELERIFLALCREHGLPRPLVNTLVLGFEVDFHWPAHRLIVETDGLSFHATRAAVERDHARDAALMAAGFVVVRFTYRQVVDEPARTARTVAQLLRGR